MVTDVDGDALPGVVVSLASPALEGQRTMVTDAAGRWRARLLPPDEYTVTLTLPGFATSRLEAMVSMGQVTRVRTTLKLEGEAEELMGK